MLIILTFDLSLFAMNGKGSVMSHLLLLDQIQDHLPREQKVGRAF